MVSGFGEGAKGRMRGAAIATLVFYLAMPAAAFANLCDMMSRGRTPGAVAAASERSPCHGEEKPAQCGHCVYLHIASHAESSAADSAPPPPAAAAYEGPAPLEGALDAVESSPKAPVDPPNEPRFLLNSVLLL